MQGPLGIFSGRSLGATGAQAVGVPGRGTVRAGAPFRSLTKTFQPTIAGSTIGSMLFEAHHREEK